MMTAGLIAGLMMGAASEECFTVEKEVVGSSLQGMIMRGDTIHVLSPECAKPALYDYIIFKTDISDNLVIKQVWGMPGDVLTVADDGGVFINGKHALTPFDKPYRLNGFFRKKLKKLEGPIEGYLALGHPGSVDSGRVGLIGPEDIVGVVRQEEGRLRETEH